MLMTTTYMDFMKNVFIQIACIQKTFIKIIYARVTSVNIAAMQ